MPTLHNHGRHHLPFVVVVLLLWITPALSLTEDGELLLRALSSLSALLPSWNALDPTPCNWTGVGCSPSSSVVSLDLQSLELSGPFPPALCLLPLLSRISLPANLLSSNLPSSSLLPCPSLAYLDLSQNLLVGPLPSLLHLLPNLLHLDLSGNNFSGAIPPSFALFPSLRDLSLVNNLLTSAAVPAFLANVTTLRQLNLSYNPFAPGPIPPELGNLTDLDTLWLAQCNLIGQIPASLGRLSSLRNLDLSGNGLVGRIPAELTNLTSAFQIELYGNSLSGEIPGGFSKLTRLRNFDASMNLLVGRIPGDLFLPPLLDNLNLYQNRLVGGVPEDAAKAERLSELRLFGNQLSGPLPADLGSRSPLVVLDLSQNRLTGAIPAGICSLGFLQELMLIDNLISGNIPADLARCTSLLRLRLSGNLLGGSVPAGLWGLPDIYLIDLARNGLTGSIGPEIGEGKNISSLLISNNQFNGKIPVEIGALRKLYELSAENNQFSGLLPPSLSSLQQIGKLDLRNNSLSGEILGGPAILSWGRLTDLDLAWNQFTGRIPADIGGLPVLNYLDLSNNHLTGEIPVQLQKLTLNHLNLSGNNLTGSVPPLFLSGGFESSFLGNPGLQSGAPDAAVRGGASSGDAYVWLVRFVLAITVVVLLAGSAWFALRYGKFRVARRERDRSKWTLTSFHKLGFSEYEILDCLDEENVLGSGASGKVYKAVLSNGETVAVKKLWGEDRFDGFEAEVVTLGRIRHKNIVKLWCCCSHRDCKLLVYEYMPNGSLGDLLHSAKSGVLGWELRRRVALDAAEGLSYLHHDCVPAIVHRDVKSNNILLDVAFGAKVADFGVAKVVDTGGKGPGSMSVIAGSCGYIAPEYAYTLRVNEKSDIYSFGVVLLELVTGRPPVGPELGEKDLTKWVCSKLHKDGFDEVVDPKLEKKFHQEIRWTLDIALQCTSSLPINRPSMRRVVKMLLDVGADSKEGNAGDKLPCHYEEDASDNGYLV